MAYMMLARGFESETYHLCNNAPTKPDVSTETRFVIPNPTSF